MENLLPVAFNIVVDSGLDLNGEECLYEGFATHTFSPFRPGAPGGPCRKEMISQSSILMMSPQAVSPMAGQLVSIFQPVSVLIHTEQDVTLRSDEVSSKLQNQTYGL